MVEVLETILKVINMEVVNETTVLEVGKFYNVKCAKMIRNANDHTYLMPIIGKPHSDSFASGLGKHYHIDGRFVSSESKFISFKNGLTNEVCELNPTQDPYRMFVGGIVIKRRKCKRLVTGVKPPDHAYKTGKYGEWYKSMVGKSCAGKKCPHYGTTMHERNGVLICPLHNLHGDLLTEKIILP